MSAAAERQPLPIRGSIDRSMPSAAAARRVYTRDRRCLDASSIRGLGECTLRRRCESVVPVPRLRSMAGLSLSMKGASSSWAFGSTDPSVVPLTVLCSGPGPRRVQARDMERDSLCRLRCQLLPCLWKALVCLCVCRCHGRLSLLRRAEGLWVSARPSVLVVDGRSFCVLLGGRRLPLRHPEELSLHK
jgi:hypothetical protein